MEDLSLLLRSLHKAMPELAIAENEPMSRHCSFRIGGCCAAMLEPSSVEETEKLCRILRESGVEPIVIGRGTNLLVCDEYLPRIVLHMGERFAAVERRGETKLFAQSGATLYKIATCAGNWGLSGLEFAQGIPGTLGGGIYMNAGAYGGELCDVAVSALWLDETLTLREGGELDLSYRHSRFTDTNDVILGALLSLKEDECDAIRERMRVLAEKRRASQPLELPSAGSTFKRPQGGYAAALIDEAGLKGFRIGGAMVSEKHAGFVVNAGGASCADVLRLIDEIRRRVLLSSGIELEPEVRILRG